MFSFLYAKYELNESESFPIKIKDVTNKTLIIAKHIGVSLSYVDTSHYFFDALKDYIREKELDKERYEVQLKRFYGSL